MGTTSRPKRYTDEFKLRIQPALSDAISQGAAKRLTTPSEYVRQSMIVRLRADGIDLASSAA